jgi:hypothetical protein
MSLNGQSILPAELPQSLQETAACLFALQNIKVSPAELQAAAKTLARLAPRAVDAPAQGRR